MRLQRLPFSNGAPRSARRALAFPATLLLAGGLFACGDGNTSLYGVASSQNTIRITSVWALSGTPATLPAAYQFTTDSPARPQILTNGAVNFDVAFDIQADNRVSVLPVRTVVPLPPAGAPVIGLQRSAQPFDGTERAPDRNYVNDSTFVVAAGETLIIRLGNAGCIYGEPFYGKFVIDSVIRAERRLVMRSLVNRNCGFRALTEGLPKT